MAAFLLTWSPERFPWTDLPREALRSGKLARMHWDTQSYGVRIPDAVVAVLERTWASLSPGR